MITTAERKRGAAELHRVKLVHAVPGSAWGAKNLEVVAAQNIQNACDTT
jgi:hypothetical protein